MLSATSLPSAPVLEYLTGNKTIKSGQARPGVRPHVLLVELAWKLSQLYQQR